MDVQLPGKLKTKAAQEEILSWLVEGFSMYRREGLTPPPAVRKATAKYFENNDYIGDFVDRYCEIGECYKVEQPELYNLFQRVYHNEYGKCDVTRQAFNQIMVNSHGLKQVKRNGGRWLLGIRLKTSSVALEAVTK